MANVTLPATGTGTATPVVETVPNAGVPVVAQRQIVALGSMSGAQVDILPSALTAGGNLSVGSLLATPTSVLTRPANTTAYSQNDLIANNVTAGSIVVPSFAGAGGSAGSGSLLSFLLLTNKTSGMGGVSYAVEFWSAAPTFTNGDNGAYAVATGAAGWLGSCSFANMIQVADGAYAQAVPDVVASIDFHLASGTSIFWTLQVTNTAAFTPASAQTFTIVPRVQQN